MGKHLILIHGRDFKPDEEPLREIWFGALRHGIAEDFDAEKAEQFDNTQKTFAYFGDLSNDFLDPDNTEYNQAEDLVDRQSALEALKNYDRSDFIGDRGEEIYEDLPGQSSIQETLADIFDHPLTWLGLSDPIISAVAPDMREYWNRETPFGKNVRLRLSDPLEQALRDEDDVLLVSHSLGSLISYDVLCEFTYNPEYQDIRERKVPTWVTLGSPLGNETVKKNLKRADEDGPDKYPHNVENWINIAAEDDYIAHDEKIKNDYIEMLKLGLIESIKDERIYNLAVREGKSNPHHGAGYLIHPAVSQIVADWL